MSVRPLKPGFVAAILNRLSGIALAVFLPLHFLALATALRGANGLESFLTLTRNPLIRCAEWGLVTALACHLALGVRVLFIEWSGLRERTTAVVTACLAGSLAVGLVFLMNG